MMAIRIPEANGPYSLLRDEELDPWLDRLCDACRYTMPANETGLPGISVPTGLDSDGLPIGVQLYGNFCCEDLLLPVRGICGGRSVRLCAQAQPVAPPYDIGAEKGSRKAHFRTRAGAHSQLGCSRGGPEPGDRAEGPGGVGTG